MSTACWTLCWPLSLLSRGLYSQADCACAEAAEEGEDAEPVAEAEADADGEEAEGRLDSIVSERAIAALAALPDRQVCLPGFLWWNWLLR